MVKGDKPRVGIIMGSDSDLPTMQKSADVLEQFGVPFEIRVLSAHRSPEATAEYATSAVDRGLEVIIAGAGGAAHLAGVVAAHTILPVIGIPIMSPTLDGLDSLLSTVQMPSGVPVATVAVGAAGASNAGILAVQIMANGDETLRGQLVDHKRVLVERVTDKDQRLQESRRAGH